VESKCRARSLVARAARGLESTSPRTHGGICNSPLCIYARDSWARPLYLSISAAHFADVPRSHSAFKFIETLYDYSTQSAQPFLDYEVRDYLNYWWGSRTRKGPPAIAYPDRAPTAGAAARIVAGLLGKPAPLTTEPRALLSRREAAELIYRHSK